MALKLLAHVFRSEIPAGDGPAATAALDPRRWVLRDLVVRRGGHAPWDVPLRSPSTASPPSREPAVEPLWSDTQPWCHE